MLAYISLQGHCFIRCANDFEKVAEPLRPRGRSRTGYRDQQLGVDVFGQFGQGCRNCIQTSDASLIAYQVDRRGLDT